MRGPLWFCRGQRCSFGPEAVISCPFLKSQGKRSILHTDSWKSYFHKRLPRKTLQKPLWSRPDALLFSPLEGTLNTEGTDYVQALRKLLCFHVLIF
jgi:hypothetical protein